MSNVWIRLQMFKSHFSISMVDIDLNIRMQLQIEITIYFLY